MVERIGHRLERHDGLNLWGTEFDYIAESLMDSIKDKGQCRQLDRTEDFQAISLRGRVSTIIKGHTKIDRRNAVRFLKQAFQPKGQDKLEEQIRAQA